MKLTPHQERILGGDQGQAAAKAMEILVALGQVFEAEALLPVRSVQVAGVSYGNLGDEGLAYLEELATDGRAVVPATLNPAGMDLDHPERMGLDEAFIAGQRRVIAAYRRLGIAAACTCTPYLAGNLPAPMETLAWSESSAVTYANSVLAARTNREGGPSALAAALTGFTPAYGLHLDSERRPVVRVELETALRGALLWGLAGRMVGERTKGEVALVVAPGPPPTLEELKAFSAALPTYGGAPIFHLLGVTPEASRWPSPERVARVSSSELSAALAEEGAGRGGARHAASQAAPDLVCLGCPHATLAELARVRELLAGRSVQIPLWLCTSRPVRALAEEIGLVDDLEAGGVTLLADTCFVVAPIGGRFRCIATNSAKGVYYARGHGGLRTRLLSMADCVEGAVTGRFY